MAEPDATFEAAKARFDDVRAAVERGIAEAAPALAAQQARLTPAVASIVASIDGRIGGVRQSGGATRSAIGAIEASSRSLAATHRRGRRRLARRVLVLRLLLLWMRWRWWLLAAALAAALAGLAWWFAEALLAALRSMLDPGPPPPLPDDPAAVLQRGEAGPGQAPATATPPAGAPVLGPAPAPESPER